MVGTSQSNDWQEPLRRKPCLWPGTGRPSLPTSGPAIHFCLGQAEKIEWRSECHKINQWVKESKNCKALQGSLACISGALTRALHSFPPAPSSSHIPPSSSREHAVKTAPERQRDWHLGHPGHNLVPGVSLSIAGTEGRGQQSA